ncbi:hypothetical protein FOA52_012173 [Chlamydomonas sp. UWO 241]|nr:hypothetical protein FOA52_012173 [Chlamydomonas sp. UWO 241]
MARGASSSAHTCSTSSAAAAAQAPVAAGAAECLERTPGGAALLDGRKVAAQWSDELAASCAELTAELRRPPGLCVVLVGDRPDSRLYVARKQEAAARVGVRCDIVNLPGDVTQALLEAEVRRVCGDPSVDGVLIQLPLPRHLDENSVMEQLHPDKDVDGFHPINMGRMLMRGRACTLVPCTPLGCLELLARCGVTITGKSCVVVGDSNVVGTPLAAMLRDRGAANVTVCHRISYREWFEDQDRVEAKRRAAAACLPRLPGPQGGGGTQWQQQAGSAATAVGVGGSRGEASSSSDSDSSDSRGNTQWQQQGGSAPTAVGTGSSSGSSGSSGSSSSGGDGGTGVSGVDELPGFQAHQLPDITRTADILVVAIGHAELVRRDWVKPGAVVIDVGINVRDQPPESSSNGICIGGISSGGSSNSSSGSSSSSRGSGVGDGGGGGSGSSSGSRGSGVSDGGRGSAADAGELFGCSGGGSGSCGVGAFAPGTYAVVGDVAFDEVSQVASAITPVPGGVGPMTIAAVLHNTLVAARAQVGRKARGLLA